MFRPRPRSVLLATVAAGALLGAAQLAGNASADVSSGDRAVLVPIETCRLIDTRPDFQVGPRPVPLGPAETVTLNTQQAGTECAGKVPTSASAVAVNVTAPDSTGDSFITLWDSGARPNGSTLNPQAGQLVFNAATVPLDGTSFRVYNNASSVHLIIDVIGYYEHHDHDDRYYTKADVDAAIDTAVEAAVSERLRADSTMVPIARFTVNTDGTVSALEYRAPVTGAPTATWLVDRWVITLPGESFFFNDQQAICSPVTTFDHFVGVASGSGDLMVFVSDAAGTPVAGMVDCVVYADAPSV